MMKYAMSVATLIVSMAILAMPASVDAHCDTLDGPVVNEARQALQRQDVTAVLKWVASEDEREVREVFQQVLAVRDQGPDARQLADRYFFETVVRVHRESEGAPYTGLKPAGQDPEPAIQAADTALEQGSIAELEAILINEIRQGLEHRFEKLQRLDRQADESVMQGREYVAAYVDFIHYAEGTHQAAAGKQPHGQGHAAEPAQHDASAGKEPAHADDPIATMEQEHQVIGKVVQAASDQLADLKKNGALDRGQWEKMHTFFVQFADRCHHAKEERYLFPILRRQGADGDLIDKLLGQHEQGRQLLSSMETLLKSDQADDDIQKGLIDSLSAYTALMNRHIHLENQQLWPQGRQRLSQEDERKLAMAFHVVEAVELGEGFHEKYHHMAHELIQE